MLEVGWAQVYNAYLPSCILVLAYNAYSPLAVKVFGQNSGQGALDRWIGLDCRVKNCNFQGSEAQIGNAFNSKGLGIDF